MYKNISKKMNRLMYNWSLIGDSLRKEEPIIIELSIFLD